MPNIDGTVIRIASDRNGLDVTVKPDTGEATQTVKLPVFVSATVNNSTISIAHENFAFMAAELVAARDLKTIIRLNVDAADNRILTVESPTPK